MLVAQGLEVVGTCGEDFRAHIRGQHQKYEPAIKKLASRLISRPERMCPLRELTVSFFGLMSEDGPTADVLY